MKKAGKKIVILNLIQDLHLTDNRGFTLIELLVVVLIIGILAAIALPQYQKAVDKSHYAQLMAAARDIASAQEVFYLEHGHYASNLDDLPITLPAKYQTNNMNFYGGGSHILAVYTDQKNSFIASYTIYYHHQGNRFAGKTYCFTYKTAYRERGKNICLGFGGKFSGINSSCTKSSPCEYYFLSNN